jgi:ATP-binding cassette subfamily C protein LapB
MQTQQKQLQWAIERLAQMQGNRLDALRLQASLQHLQADQPPPGFLGDLCNRMGYIKPQWLQKPDPAKLPLIACTADQGWVVVIRQTTTNGWVVVNNQGSQQVDDTQFDRNCAIVDTQIADVKFGAGIFFQKNTADKHSFMAMLWAALREFKPQIIEAAVASAFIAMLALAVSLFSMQVYDRVIPTRGEHTLIILASGVALVILVELAMKFARAKVMDHIIVGLDNRLSRDVFARLLSLRVDQLPPSVGSLAGQVRGYEQVRSFYTASTLFTLIDLPMGVLFIFLIMFIGHPVVAAVPLFFGLAALYIGLSMRAKITQQALAGAQFSNLKTGLLVEAVEGIETIKAGSGGWKFLSRWLGVTEKTIHNDLKTRQLTEGVQYMSASMQQLSYAGVVVAGAWAVIQGHMTMGGLIACSILSGRILAPVLQLPNLLVQHAHARAAIEGLEKIYSIHTDEHNTQAALTPDDLKGHYQLSNAAFFYGDNPPALTIQQLDIQPAERVVVLGPIGSGKSTFLRLLSGLYQPRTGRIQLDGLDLSQIHRQILSDHIGYLQQDHRLFVGTLRENLLVGLPDPGDGALIDAMRRTGMDTFVAAHPQGIQRPIAEGGNGLSGGQKQLLAFTRIILTQPQIMLLDEPTATMDEEQERRCLQVLNEEARAGKTMVIATHKPSLLQLATRIIVIAGSKIVVDGPRDHVLQQLRNRSQANNASNHVGTSSHPSVTA